MTWQLAIVPGVIVLFGLWIWRKAKHDEILKVLGAMILGMVGFGASILGLVNFTPLLVAEGVIAMVIGGIYCVPFFESFGGEIRPKVHE